jgi:hypothetical protein
VYAGARLDADRLRGRGLYGYIDRMVPPVWLDQPGPVPIVDSAQRIHVMVAGGEFGGYTAALLGEGVTVTRKVEAS